MSDLEAFRTETRAWLEANCPPTMRGNAPMDGRRQFPSGAAARPRSRIRSRSSGSTRMAARGFTAPTWPKEYGGAGLSNAEARVLQQELGRLKARPALMSFGIWMLGPVLLEYATEEQKKKFLAADRAPVKSAGARVIPSPAPVPISRGFAPRAVDKGESLARQTARKSGRPMPTRPTGFSLPRAHRQHQEARRHLVPSVRHGLARRGAAADQAHQRPVAVLRDCLHRREGAQDQLVGKLNGGWEIAKRLLQYERQNISAGGFGRWRRPGL